MRDTLRGEARWPRKQEAPRVRRRAYGDSEQNDTARQAKRLWTERGFPPPQVKDPRYCRSKAERQSSRETKGGAVSEDTRAKRDGRRKC